MNTQHRGPLKLYAHPFSSYCQKAIVALYENNTPFELMILEDHHPENKKYLQEHWPIAHFPLLVDGEQCIVESTIIIEHLQIYHPGPVQLLPPDAVSALPIRLMDRFIDLWLHNQNQKIIWDVLRKPELRDPTGVAEARALIEKSYGILNTKLSGHEWAVGNEFSLADCAAAPALFYSDWTQPISEKYPEVRAYRKRLLARPSFARAVNEARPFRSYFPLGAPDRD